jgi:hypothetical protein
LSRSDNQHGSSATIKRAATTKILAKRDHRHDHQLATGRRFTLRLPLPFSSRLSRNKQPRKRPFVPRWSPEPISTEISLPVEMLEGIELWAAAHSIPRSRAIRLLVYRGLAHVGMPQTEAAREAIR